MNANPIDTLGKKLGDAALTFLVGLYPDVRNATSAQLDAACAAMRAKAKPVVDELLDDARDAPGVAHLALQTAALTLVHESIWVLRRPGNRSANLGQKRLASLRNSAFMPSRSTPAKEQEMTTQQSIETIVTNTNGRLRGVMDVQVEFYKGVPCEVIHAGRTYHATGKEGAHMATGRLTREMATDDDARLWITLDATHVWED